LSVSDPGSLFSWQGASGRWYEADVVRAKRAWEPVGGVYMFVKPGDFPSWEAGGPVALYVAQTDNFAATLTRHDEMWASAQQLGAGEIHLIEVAEPALRIRVERDLEAQTPILNKQMLRRVA
jgi:hypothetical protein